MIFRINLEKLPVVHAAYTVTRKTVWQISDSANILIFIHEGRCEFTINNEAVLLKKGDMLFIPKNQLYTRRPTDDEFCTMTYIHFFSDFETEALDIKSAKNEIERLKSDFNSTILTDKVCPHLTEAYILQVSQITDTDTDADLLFRRAVSCHSKNLIESTLLSSLTLGMILGAATHTALRTVLSDRETTLEKRIPPKLNKAILFIKSNYTVPISLSDLCRHCNVSKQQMIRYFRQELNTTPTAYILLFKMNKAKEFLSKNPHLTVKEVAFELGYENPLYFTRIFAKICGETPSHYKYRVANFERLNPNKTVGTVVSLP